MRSVNKKEAAFGFLFFYFGALVLTVIEYDQGFSRQYLLQHIGRAYITETLYVQRVILQ